MKTLARLFYRIKYGSPIVVVSGLPRSGTSMLMQMLEAGGLEVVSDHVRIPDQDNPRGYYELERVKHLEKETDKTWLAGCRGKAVKIISYLLKQLPLFFTYKVVFIQRDIDEILLSQKKMLENRGENTANLDDEKMRQHYLYHLKQVAYELDDRSQFDVLYVRQRDILNRPAEEARRINVFLGGRLNTEAMSNAVHTVLYRNRVN